VRWGLKGLRRIRRAVANAHGKPVGQIQCYGACTMRAKEVLGGPSSAGAWTPRRHKVFAGARVGKQRAFTPGDLRVARLDTHSSLLMDTRVTNERIAPCSDDLFAKAVTSAPFLPEPRSAATPRQDPQAAQT
jgi:hypothetical protein